jgi:DNA-binding response OmpR family regulator
MVNSARVHRSTATDVGQRLSVPVLGSLQVRRREHVLTTKELGGPRQSQILEILLLSPGVPVSKHHLLELVWGDTTRPVRWEPWKAASVSCAATSSPAGPPQGR